MAKSKPYENRIVSSGVKPASDFLAHNKNFRIHPRAQQEALDGVLSEVGWVQNVIVSARSGMVIDGHARVLLALRKGDDTPVPFIEVDVNEREEVLILASLDTITGLASFDKEKLDALLQSVQTGDAAVMAMLADLAKDAGLDYGAEERDAEPAFDRAEALRGQWGVEPGNLYGIGLVARCPKCGKMHNIE